MYSCSSGYSSDAGATACSKCNTRLANCEKCSSLNCCTSCNSVSYLSGCNCVACSNIANCSVCSSSSTCTRCNSGYYKNGIEWYDKTLGESMIPGESKFVGGHTYCMNIWIGVMEMKIKNKIKEASLKKVLLNGR